MPTFSSFEAPFARRASESGSMAIPDRRGLSSPRRRVVPQNERSFDRHEGSAVLGNNARSVIGCGTIRGNTHRINEAVYTTDQAVATGPWMAPRPFVGTPLR